MKVATGTADDIRAIDLAAADGRTIAPETGREELAAAMDRDFGDDDFPW